jgi:putative (di)nucleoside polyphosphate hydrolase
VGAVIVNRSGQVLAFERARIPGAWQLPQGGWEAGETAEEALFREVAEETGLRRDQLELLFRHPEPLVYELPAEWQTTRTGLGQVLYWYQLRLHQEETVLTLPPDGEFRAWRWMPMHRLLEETRPFRRALYRRLQAEFKL